MQGYSIEKIGSDWAERLGPNILILDFGTDREAIVTGNGTFMPLPVQWQPCTYIPR